MSEQLEKIASGIVKTFLEQEGFCGKIMPTNSETCRIILIYASGSTYRHPNSFFLAPERKDELRFLNNQFKDEIEKYSLADYLKEIEIDFWKESKVKHTFILNKKIYNLTKQIQFL